ncbi:MAG: energy-coupling factor transporter transmembrane component T [Nitrososphaerota archaeon]
MSESRFIKYIEGKSIIHNLDPRAKIIFVFSILFSLTISPSLILIIPLLIISFLFYLLAKLPLKKTITTWKFVLIIVVVLSMLNLLTLSILYKHGGNIIFEFSWFAITDEIIQRAIFPVMKLLSLAIVTITLIFTTPPKLYAPALGQMHVPYKPAYIIQLAFRYIPEYIVEMRKTLEAQMARGFKPKGGKNPLAKILSIIPLIVPVTISAALSIYDIADAMELRGFGEKENHTWYRKLDFNRKDIFLIILSIFIVLIYIFSYFYFRFLF